MVTITKSMLSFSDIFETVQYVGKIPDKPTSVLLDMATWQKIIHLLEVAEEQGLFQDYVARRRQAVSPQEMGLISWADIEADLEV
jgi:hypothetical protein